MPQDKDRSFVATMTTNYGNLHLPKLTYGKTTKIKKTDYDTWSFDTYVDVSNTLCVKGDTPYDQIKFYFYCIDDYYSIYLLTDGFYHRYALSNEDKDIISAFRANSEQTTFNLLDGNGRIVTLDQIDTAQPILRIQTRGGRTLSVRGNHSVGGLVCTGKGGGSALNFKLNILSQGAA